jgi:hypothetical protein
LGDFLGQNVRKSILVVELINGLGGQAEVLMLGSRTGLEGDTYFAFVDGYNEDVAGLRESRLQRMGLDGGAERKESGWRVKNLGCRVQKRQKGP